jgi:signal transduction histidine kinase/ActR/RegA family two-component response regulator
MGKVERRARDRHTPIAAADPDGRLRQRAEHTVRGTIRRGGAVVVVIASLALLPVMATFRDAGTSEHERERFAEAATTADLALQLTLEIQGSTRGFVITQDETFVEPRAVAIRQLPAARAALRQVTGDLKPPAARLDANLGGYTRYSRRLLLEARANPRTARSTVATAEGARRVAAIRDDVHRIAELATTRANAQAAAVTASAERALVIAAVGVLLTLFTIGLFTNWLSRLITRPLERIAAASGRLGAGDASARVAVAGPHELAELAEAFNAMAASLQSSRERVELRNRELADAHEDTKRANLAKSEFLSRMSHELRTPLHSVLGFSQLLAADLEDPAQRERVDRILRAGHHLLALIDEVLDISRIETGSASISPEPVRVAEVIAQTVEMLSATAAARDITVEHPAEGDCEWIVTADRQRLRQVLLNLLSNAIKYNREGGDVRIDCAASESGRNLRIAVADTGPGLSTDQQARLFEPFNRLGAEAGDVQGTGLGLALSRGLVQLMGGTLGFESTEGEGSTFHLELPLAELPAALQESRGSVAPAHPEAANGSGSDTTVVLCIEDNPLSLEVLEHALRKLPAVELRVAREGGTGLDLARAQRPAIVLLDLHLPDMSGEAVLERLRGTPETAAIPVVVISADVTERQQGRLLAAGATAYMTKPIVVEELLTTIRGQVPALNA